MGLNKLTNRIYFLEHAPEVDRPMLAYLKGDKISLAIDAGYSASHVQDFYRAIDVYKRQGWNNAVLGVYRGFPRKNCGRICHRRGSRGAVWSTGNKIFSRPSAAFSPYGSH